MEIKENKLVAVRKMNGMFEVKYTRGGSIPKELEGDWNSEGVAQNAIRVYQEAWQARVDSQPQIQRAQRKAAERAEAQEET